jgi:hypothetical protein
MVARSERESRGFEKQFVGVKFSPPTRSQKKNGNLSDDS